MVGEEECCSRRASTHLILRRILRCGRCKSWHGLELACFVGLRLKSEGCLRIIVQEIIFTIKCLHQYVADVHFSGRDYRGMARVPAIRFGSEVQWW